MDDIDEKYTEFKKLYVNDKTVVSLVTWSHYSDIPIQILFNRLIEYALNDIEAIRHAIDGGNLSKDFDTISLILQIDAKEHERKSFNSLLENLKLDLGPEESQDNEQES